MIWKRKRRNGWHRKFAFIPHKTQEGYTVWLARVWRLGMHDCNYIINSFDYSLTGPAVATKEYKDNVQKARCMFCDTGDYPVCFDCKKAVLAFKTIAQ